jgi:tetratricopeptide (TPR) repeat protein
MEHQQKQPGITVFYSYASADKEWRDQLAIHLSQLRRDGQIEEWSELQILPGSDRAQAIDQALHSAHLILLLISADFLASDICYHEDMQLALERHKRGEARVIPIIVRPCDWQSSLFAHLQYLPRDGQPITTWTHPDEAFVDIVAGIRQVVEDLVLLPAKHPLSVLPSVWTVPYRRNPLFTGREWVLTYLHEKLTSHHSVALTQPQAISGLGGIGKTQTAVEYAYRYRDDYSVVLWVRADTPEMLISDFVSIAHLLKLAERNAQDQRLIVNAVKHWLEASPDCLLILDNADDLTIIQNFLPASGKGHILLTTRARPMGKLAQRVELGRMAMEEGTLFLLRRAGIIVPEASLEAVSSTDRTQAQELVTLLDGLPLALDQAGAYIEETGTDLSHYLKLYKSERKRLLKRRSKFPTDHPESVASTWSLSFQKIEKLNAVAANVLRFCAFLQPDAIPEELLIVGTPTQSNLPESIVSDPLQFDEAIGDLLRFSLVGRHPQSKTLSIHRLVQVVLKDEMDVQMQRYWAERVIRVVDRAFPDRSRVKTWSEWQRYLPQAQACAGLIEQWNILLPEAAYLLRQAGTYLTNRSQYQEAEIFLKQAIAISEQTQEWKVSIASLSRLAHLCTQQGRVDEAESYLQQSLAVQEQMLGPEHPEISRGLEDLISFYLQQKKYEQAESLIQRALTVRSRDRTPKHLGVADILDHLAELYVYRGQFDQAEEVIDQILTHLKQAQEENENNNYRDMHRWIGGLSSLVRIYMGQRKYEQAEPLVTQILEVWGQELEPLTAQSLNDLADICTVQGKYEQAERLRLRALNVWEQIMGPGDGFTEGTRMKLAQFYIEQGKYEQATAIYAQAAVPFALNGARAYLNRGYLFLHLKNRESAYADFARLAEFQPKNVNAAWMAVFSNFNKQKPGVEVAVRLEMIAELDPQSDEAYVCRGVALGLRGKLQEGLTELEHMLHLDARNEDALFWKGMMCAYLDRSTVAMESIEQALQAGLPPLLLTPLFWLEQERPHFYQEYAEPLLKQYALL